MTFDNSRLVKTNQAPFTIDGTTYISQLDIRHDNAYYLVCTLYRDNLIGQTEIDSLMRHAETTDEISSVAEKLTHWAVKKANERHKSISLSIDISVETETPDSDDRDHAKDLTDEHRDTLDVLD